MTFGRADWGAATEESRRVFEAYVETVTLTVFDDGVGFAESAAVERSRRGHLGLSLLADLVREHGGELEIKSAPGKGTRVRSHA